MWCKHGRSLKKENPRRFHRLEELHVIQQITGCCKDRSQSQVPFLPLNQALHPGQKHPALKVQLPGLETCAGIYPSSKGLSTLTTKTKPSGEQNGLLKAIMVIGVPAVKDSITADVCVLASFVST